jgi:hypothetical protein
MRCFPISGKVPISVQPVKNQPAGNKAVKNNCVVFLVPCRPKEADVNILNRNLYGTAAACPFRFTTTKPLYTLFYIPTYNIINPEKGFLLP